MKDSYIFSKFEKPKRINHENDRLYWQAKYAPKNATLVNLQVLVKHFLSNNMGAQLFRQPRRPLIFGMSLQMKGFAASAPWRGSFSNICYFSSMRFLGRKYVPKIRKMQELSLSLPPTRPLTNAQDAIRIPRFRLMFELVYPSRWGFSIVWGLVIFFSRFQKTKCVFLDKFKQSESDYTASRLLLRVRRAVKRIFIAGF